jgi:hypothetical protein
VALFFAPVARRQRKPSAHQKAVQSLRTAHGNSQDCPRRSVFARIYEFAIDTLSTINPHGTRQEMRKLMGMVLIPFAGLRHATSKLHQD